MAEVREPGTDVARRLRAVCGNAVDERRVAGGVVVVALDGDVVAHEAFGHSNVSLGISTQTEEKYRLASVTKPIVSLAVMKLVAAGEIRLHEPVTRWLPYFRPSLADGSVPEVTLHHLLSHASGLSYRFLEPLGTDYEQLAISDGLDCCGMSLEENLHRLSRAKLRFRPGVAWGYSLAIDVVGAIIEQVTGHGLPAAIETLISAPLQLSSLAFNVPLETALAVPYSDSSGELNEMASVTEIVPPDGVGAIRFSPKRAYETGEFPSGGAGMVGSAMDVLRILEVVRQQGDGFIDSEWARQMVYPHVSADVRGQGDGWGFGYLGAVLEDPSVMKTPQRPGTVEWGGVYGHSWFMDRAAGLTVVSLTSTTWEGVGGRFPKEVRDTVYAAIA